MLNRLNLLQQTSLRRKENINDQFHDLVNRDHCKYTVNIIFIYTSQTSSSITNVLKNTFHLCIKYIRKEDHHLFALCVPNIVKFIINYVLVFKFRY